MKKYLLVLLVTLVLTVCCYKFVVTLGYSDYKDLLGALLNISSIIFAIIGAWIAIIYPQLMSHSFTSSKGIAEVKNARNDTDYLSNLVEIVMSSAFVLMLVLTSHFIFPVIKSMGYFGIPISIIKIIAFFVISFMTLIQLQAIFRVILANYFFLSKLRNKNAKDYIDNLHSK